MKEMTLYNYKVINNFSKDPCLYNELTISESFYYFAKLHCVDNSDIKIRKEFLMNLLELPDQNRKVKNLRYNYLYFNNYLNFKIKF